MSCGTFASLQSVHAMIIVVCRWLGRLVVRLKLRRLNDRVFRLS